MLRLDCLHSYTSQEKLTDSEKYYCGRCHEKQEATKKFTVVELPEVLCLQLKRFRWRTVLRNKIDAYVQFPTVLDMEEYSRLDATQGPALFQLYGVVIHHGAGSLSGHYTSCCRSAVDGTSGLIYDFCGDESDVSRSARRSVAVI